MTPAPPPLARSPPSSARRAKCRTERPDSVAARRRPALPAGGGPGLQAGSSELYQLIDYDRSIDLLRDERPTEMAMQPGLSPGEYEARLRRATMLLMLISAFLVGVSVAFLIDLVRFNAMGRIDFIVAMLPLVAGTVFGLAGNIRLVLSAHG
jgi:hypothetical protein